MHSRVWVQDNRRNLVCVDSYEEGVMKGRFFGPRQDMEIFESLSQFLVRMEGLLNDLQAPRSYTEARTFSELPEENRDPVPAGTRRGNRATFELNVLFRQHSSWQGTLLWREQGREHSFRSVLELVLLMDSALRGPGGKGAA